MINCFTQEVDFINLEPKNFTKEQSTLWAFPERGSWATHSGKYRGNWSPYIPRNIILRYSEQGDWVLDQFMGSGTTLIEAKLLNRNAIGIDINKSAISLSEANLNFNSKTKSKILIKQADARKISFIKTSSLDLICMHPPYANIIKYSENIEDDISLFSYDEFLIAMEQVALEAFRVLKSNKICSVMMGDIRKRGNVTPLGFQTMNVFIKAGFKLKEIIIKEQHNCKMTKFWEARERDFLLLAHEYIYIFYK